MLHEFLTTHRAELLRRIRTKVASRSTPPSTDIELEKGIPLFLDQLTDALRDSSTGGGLVWAVSAAKHGSNLLRMGFTIGQVVHDYGDVCQAVTELAHAIQAPISVDEFHTLNRCLDDAVAYAVTEYARQRDRVRDDQETERLGFFAHELRNHLGSAMLAYAALKTGRVGLSGSTADVVDRSFHALRDLIDRSLVDVRIASGTERRDEINVASLVTDIGLHASLEAETLGIDLVVGPVDPTLVVESDRMIIAAAAANLLQNAFKFGRPKGRVDFRTTANDHHVTFEIEDECGGLAPGAAEELFGAFIQRNQNQSGLGLGLAISRRGIEASGGRLTVQDLPGKGCIFAIRLPRTPTPAIAPLANL